MVRSQPATISESDGLQQNLLSHAAAYARKGWALVPLWWIRSIEHIDRETGEVYDPGACACPRGESCSSPGKHPHTKHGSAQPLKTVLDVEIYWSRNPNCNIGIATGKASGLVVLDIDPAKDGVTSMRQLFLRYGPPADTPVSITGRNGRHILYRHPGQKVKNAIGYKPGIDVRADGGLIVVPPSLHISGRRYKWHPNASPKDHEPAEMPAWMTVFLEADETRRAKRNLKMYGKNRIGRGSKYGRALDPDSLPQIGEGERNDTLCSIAGRLIWENRDEQEIMMTMHKINAAKCSPPLPEKEVTTLVTHAYRRWSCR